MQQALRECGWNVVKTPKRMAVLLVGVGIVLLPLEMHG